MVDRIQRLGRITTWKDEQGFGFITPKGGGNEVFVHVKAFSNRLRRPKTADIVTYELTTDAKGRLRAERVGFFGDEPLPAVRGGGKSLALPAIFFLILIAALLMRRLPFLILAVYAAASAFTFVVYARDKSAAQRNARAARVEFDWRLAWRRCRPRSASSQIHEAVVPERVLDNSSSQLPRVCLAVFSLGPGCPTFHRRLVLSRNPSLSLI